MAEWLGKGLQNLVQRFESASDLTETALQIAAPRFSFCINIICIFFEEWLPVVFD